VTALVVYWMERGTKGSVESVGYSRKLYGTFASAQSAVFEAHGQAAFIRARRRRLLRPSCE
jgi:hypothetical protein